MGLMMRKLLCAAIFAGFAFEANAATFKYYYEGPALNVAYGDEEGTDDWLGKSFNASLVIDEDLLGQSLKNADLSFYLAPLPQDDVGPVGGIIGFSWSWPTAGSPGFNDPTTITDPCCGGNLVIKTDS